MRFVMFVALGALTAFTGFSGAATWDIDPGDLIIERPPATPAPPPASTRVPLWELPPDISWTLLPPVFTSGPEPTLGTVAPETTTDAPTTAPTWTTQAPETTTDAPTTEPTWTTQAPETTTDAPTTTAWTTHAPDTTTAPAWTTQTPETTEAPTTASPLTHAPEPETTRVPVTATTKAPKATTVPTTAAPGPDDASVGDGGAGVANGGVPFTNSTVAPVESGETQLLVYIIAGCVVLGVVIVALATAFFCLRRRRRAKQEHDSSPIAIVAGGRGVGGALGAKRKPSVPETALERRRRDKDAGQPFGNGQPSPHSQFATQHIMQPSQLVAGPYAGAEMSPQHPGLPNAGMPAYQQFSSGQFYHSPHAPGSMPPAIHPLQQQQQQSWANIANYNPAGQAAHLPLPQTGPSMPSASGFPFGRQEQRANGQRQAPAAGRGGVYQSSSSSGANTASSPTIPLQLTARDAQPYQPRSQQVYEPVDYGRRYAAAARVPPTAQRPHGDSDEDSSSHSTTDDENASLSGAMQRSHSTSRAGLPALSHTVTHHHV